MIIDFVEKPLNKEAATIKEVFIKPKRLLSGRIIREVFYHSEM
jgi:hypothetical protein